MGNYDPHLPYILGQEWVPIRDEDLVYSPNVNAVELGTAYTQAADRQIRSARFYVNDMQPTSQFAQVGLVNIYPYGLEDQTGPIQQVLIPCSSGVITGTNVSLAGGAATVAEAVYQPGDGKSLEFDYNSTTPQTCAFWFKVSDYPVLANKRILNVSLMYSGYVQDRDPATGLFTDYVDPNPSTLTTNVSQRTDTGTQQPFSPPTFLANTGALTLGTSVANAPRNASADQQINALDMGDINNMWNIAAPLGTSDRMSWRYTDLLRLQETFGAGRQHIWLQVQLPTTPYSTIGPTFPTLWIEYMALRVIYCEEKRVAYGGKRFIYTIGMNDIPVRDLSFNADPVLAAGRYLPTLSWVSPGQIDYGEAANGDFPDLNAVRELYQIPSHPAVQINVPFPLAERLGQTFTSQVTHVLPQLSLHASGGTLTEPHVYGRQAEAQVYGTNVATQGIAVSAGAAASYPQVRYYARRFGDTTIPLTLAGTSAAGLALPGVAGSYASTPDTAVLDIIGDIDLRADVTLPAPNSFMVVLAKFNATGNQKSYLIQLSPSNTLDIVWSPDGSSELFASSSPLPNAQSGRMAVRATLDVDNGAAGRTITFYTAPTMAGPFTALGSPVVQAGVTSIFSSTSVLEVGSAGTGTVSPMTGTVHAVQVLNGIAGVAVANPDFSAQAPGTTSFNDAAGRPWTVNGRAAIVAGNTASSAAITVADFDALAEIVDGWREVTIRFPTPSTPSAVTGGPYIQNWTWSAAGETAGNRWEILAASAPAMNSTTGSLITQVANPNQLGVATYQPDQGATVNLTWMPWGVQSAWVTGSTADLRTDAVLMFSQDPPTVTGLGISQLTQAVSGIGGFCGSTPCCIPTGIGYHQLSWTAATSLPVSGFGAYELQRYDPVTGGDFQTIMLSTAVSGTGFRDYEARVGVQAVYRIRTLNVLNFAGPWSTYVSGAPPAPGVTGGCGAQDGALIFTSNASQPGTNNAAYIMQWDGTPNETFDLPEADMVTFQPMYGRDGSVAFHGTERGLEQFSRNVLLQAGAIALPSLADATTIRDLAWAQLPYVCVRDDRGNRWYANVRVPAVNARNNAQNYTARLDITETTRTPYPVNP